MGINTLNITFARSDEVGNRNYYRIVVEGLAKIPPGRDVSRHTPPIRDGSRYSLPTRALSR